MPTLVTEPDPPITVELWNEANAAKIADLDETWGRSWQDVRNDTGTCKVSMFTDHPQADALTVGRHLRFYLGATLAVTAVIGDGDNERTLAGDGDDAAKITNVRSRGLGAAWDDATVQPTNGVGGSPYSDRRAFSWASLVYDRTRSPAWPTCFQYADYISTQTQLDPPYHSPWYPPRGWPTLNAEWIWPVDRGGVYPPGRALMMLDINITVPGPMSHFIAGDGRVRLFIDGLEVHPWTEGWPVQSFLETYACTVELDAGLHRIGIEAEVYDDLLPLGRPPRGMAAWCAHAEDGSGVYNGATQISETHAATWYGRDLASGGVYPAPTPHDIMSAVLTECQAVGQLTGWSLSSSATLDSSGATWDRPIEVVCRVGDSALDLLKQLASTSIDFAFDPSGKTVHMWNKGNRGTTVPGAAIVADSNAYRIVRTQ